MKKLLFLLLLIPGFLNAQIITNQKQGAALQRWQLLGGLKVDSAIQFPWKDSARYGSNSYYSDIFINKSDSLVKLRDPRTGFAAPLQSSVTPEAFGVVPNTGVDVSTGMQSAINFAASKNIKLVLAAGTYIVKNLTLPDNANISGQSFNTILYLANGSETDKQVFTIAAGTSLVSLSDLVIDANKANQSGSNVVCLKVINDDTAAANKIEFITFRNVTFKNSKDRALTWFRGFRIENTVIENCVFSNAGVQAVELRGCKNFTFRNNFVTAWGEATTSAPGFGLQSVINDGINITGNYFSNTVGGQFAIESAGAFVQNCSIVSNTFDGNNQPAAGVSGYFRQSTFSFNKHIRGVGTHRTGYELIGNDLIVSNNYIDNGAIVFTSDEVNPVAEVRPNGNNCIIANNIIKTNATNASSIYLNGFVRNDTISTVTNVEVTGNLIDNRGSTGNSATISVGFYGTAGLVSGVKIHDNKIYADASQPCVRLRSSDTSSNLIITKNEFISGLQAIRIDAPAAWLNVEISDNDFRGVTSSEYVFGTGTFNAQFRVLNNVYTTNYQSVKINSDRFILSGSGTPESSVTGPVGSFYLRTDGAAGTTAYIKETGSGNTGWSAIASSSGGATLSGTQTFTGVNTFSQQILSTAAAGALIANSGRGAALTTAALTSHSSASGVDNIIIEGTRPGTPSASGFRLWVGASDNHAYLRSGNTDYHFLINNNEFVRFFNTGAMHVSTLGTTPVDNSSVIFQVTSTAKGVLLPKMTSTQRLAITTPATGLLLFDTTLGKFAFYNGTAWEAITSTVIP